VAASTSTARAHCSRCVPIFITTYESMHCGLVRVHGETDLLAGSRRRSVCWSQTTLVVCATQTCTELRSRAISCASSERGRSCGCREVLKGTSTPTVTWTTCAASSHPVSSLYTGRTARRTHCSTHAHRLRGSKCLSCQWQSGSVVILSSHGTSHGYIYLSGATNASRSERLAMTSQIYLFLW
jgi:hypothetical protein